MGNWRFLSIQNLHFVSQFAWQMANVLIKTTSTSQFNLGTKQIGSKKKCSEQNMLLYWNRYDIKKKMYKNFKSPYTCTPGARRLIHIFVDILCWLNKYSVVIHHNRRLQKYFSDFRFGSYFFLEKKNEKLLRVFLFSSSIIVFSSVSREKSKSFHRFLFPIDDSK